MKKYGIFLLIFLLILAVCTYISSQVYQDSLPAVTTATAVSAQLQHHWTLTGQLLHENPDTYTFPVPVAVLEYKFQTGQWVSAGKPLLQLDTRQLRLQWLQCQLDAQALEKQSDTSAGYEKELLQYKLDTLLETLQQLDALIAQEGWVYARADGVVLQAGQPGNLPAHTAAMTLGPASGRKQILFPITQLQKQHCLPDTQLRAVLTLDTGTATEKLSAGWVYYSAAQQGYLCVVNTHLPLNMLDGQAVTATLNAYSEPYPTVIPTAAIVSNDNGNVSFYTLEETRTVMGTEYIAILRTGYALEQTQLHTALAQPLTEPVIVSWDQPLSHGCTVRLS